MHCKLRWDVEGGADPCSADGPWKFSLLNTWALWQEHVLFGRPVCL